MVDGGLGSLSLCPSLVTTVRDPFLGDEAALAWCFFEGKGKSTGCSSSVCLVVSILKDVPPYSNDGCALG